MHIKFDNLTPYMGIEGDIKVNSPRSNSSNESIKLKDINLFEGMQIKNSQ